MLNGLSLFSGIGGIDLALSEWVRPVAYCEIDNYAAAVLFSRMADGSIPTAPVWPDVRSLTAKLLPSIDIIFCGFPCQDVSLAGNRKGLEGKRTGLFFEIVRLVAECRPAFVFLENVPGIKPYRQEIFTAFEKLGYDCRDGTLAAGHLGACHIRNRWWLVAYNNQNGWRKLHGGQQIEGGGRTANFVNSCPPSEHQTAADRGITGGGDRLENQNTFTDSENERCCRAEYERERLRFGSCVASGLQWPTESGICGADDGIPRRLDRIRCLGNAVVPQCAKEAFKRLIGIK